MIKVCQERVRDMKVGSLNGFLKALVVTIIFVIFSVGCWVVGWVPFWKGPSSNLFPDSIALETNLSLENWEFKNSVCKSNIQEYVKLQKKRSYISSDFLFKTTIETNLLAGNKVEVSYKNGVLRKRFEIIANGPVEIYGPDSYIANINAKEINHNPFKKSKAYRGTIHKYRDHIKLTLVNYSGLQKNVISVLPIRQLDSVCATDDYHIVQEIKHLNEVSGNLNDNSEFSAQSIEPQYLCKRSFHGYQGPDINWPEENTYKKVIIKPIFLTTRADSIELQKVDDLPFVDGMNKRALKSSLSTMIRVQSELYCSVNSVVRDNISLQIAGVDISTLCGFDDSEKLQTEIEKLQRVNVFKAKDIKSISELISYTDEETHELGINNPNKQRSDKQKAIGENAKSLIAAATNTNSEQNVVGDSFNLYIFIGEASLNHNIPLGEAIASTIGASSNRNWVFVEAGGLGSVTIQHELGHLFALTHLTTKQGLLYTKTNHPNPNFHGDHFSQPQYGINPSEKKIYHTVNINEVLDRQYLIKQHGPADLIGSAYPSEQGLICSQDYSVELCTDTDTCNGARNSLASLSRFIESLPEPLDFNIEVKDKIQRGEPLVITWQGDFPEDGEVKVLSTATTATLPSRSVNKNSLSPLEILADLPRGEYSVQVKFSDSNLDTQRTFQVIETKAEPQGPQVNFVKIDDKGKPNCKGEWIEQCEFIVTNANMQCVAAVEYNKPGCYKTNGCGDIISGLAKINPEDVSSLFIIGSSDTKLTDMFSQKDNEQLAKQRGSSLGNEVAEKLNLKSFSVCPEIGRTSQKRCNNIGFHSDTKRYAAAFIFNQKTTKNVYKDRCVSTPLVCNDNEKLENGICVLNPVICPTTHELSEGLCLPREVDLQCPDNFELESGSCIKRPLICNDNEKLENGICVLDSVICPTTHELSEGLCLPREVELQCPDNFELESGSCIERPLICNDNERLENELCVSIEKEKDTIGDVILFILSIAVILAI